MLTVGLALAPVAGEAQQAASLPRIGFLATASLSDPRVPPFLQAFRQGLRELGYLGYVEGQNIAIEFRWAEGQYDRLPGLAAELVRLKVNVIVAAGPNAIQAAKQATETIPIVMTAVADPVATGFVASLARPGGNITGISNCSPTWSASSWRCSRRSFPRSLGWPSSGIRPIPSTHRCCDTRRTRPGHWGSGFNPWRHGTAARSTAPWRQSPRSGPAPSSFSRTRCSSITAHESPTTQSGAACRWCPGLVSSPRPVVS